MKNAFPSRFRTVGLVVVLPFLISACSGNEEIASTDPPLEGQTVTLSEDADSGLDDVSEGLRVDPTDTYSSPDNNEPDITFDTETPDADMDPCDQCTVNEECVNDDCIPICIPDCENKSCGSDGCSGSCGMCSFLQACVGGECTEICTNCSANTDCPSGFTCQGDPVGTLGITFCSPPCQEDSPCPSGMECTPGASFCLPSPQIQCHQSDVYAGNSCGDLYWVNETCPEELPCSTTNNQCGCPEENCAGRECGTNGCSTGDCGTCETGEDCVGGQCCVSNCNNKSCGSDGCGRICGVCSPGDTCNEQGQCCTPFECGDKECGLDALGCPCGDCGPLGECVDGLCECTPECNALECGSDGCGSSCGCCADGFQCKEGACTASDTCGGCPTDFTCDDGKCIRLSVEGCWDTLTDKAVDWKGQCLDPHTVRYCDGNQDTILSCLSPDAKRRSGTVAKGAVWCGLSSETGLVDCQTNPPCNSSPCSPLLESSGCPNGAPCQEGLCQECIPDCEGLECGDDGCGFPCGTCLSSIYSNDIDEQMPAENCLEGLCQCTPSCPDEPFPCGPDGCGGSCGDCPEGDIWSCGEERYCLCTPACEDKHCGSDGCSGKCGPGIKITDQLEAIVESLAECPDSSTCGVESQVCEGNVANAICNGISGDSTDAPLADDVIGFNSNDSLPTPLDMWVETLVNQGNPCSSLCPTEVELRDILLYVMDAPETEEMEEAIYPPPQSLWVQAHVTLRVLNEEGEDSWLFTFKLNNGGSTIGTEFRPQTTSVAGSLADLSEDTIEALKSIRGTALEEQKISPETAPFSASNISVQRRSWGCTPHHTLYTEPFPILEKNLSVVGDVEGEPADFFWVTETNAD